MEQQIQWMKTRHGKETRHLDLFRMLIKGNFRSVFVFVSVSVLAELFKVVACYLRPPREIFAQAYGSVWTDAKSPKYNHNFQFVFRLQGAARHTHTHKVSVTIVRNGKGRRNQRVSNISFNLFDPS